MTLAYSRVGVNSTSWNSNKKWPREKKNLIPICTQQVQLECREKITQDKRKASTDILLRFPEKSTGINLEKQDRKSFRLNVRRLPKLREF